MDSLGVANKGALYTMYMKEMVSLENFPQILKSLIKIASAHIHISRNNPAKFQKYPMDSLGEVADKRPLYNVYERNCFRGNFPPK